MIEGRGPAPSLCLALIERLPDDSMTAAIASGGPEHFGWGMERHILASLFDAINVNTRVTGQFKKGSEPKIPEFPRPGTEAAKPAPKSVAALYKQMNRR